LGLASAEATLALAEVSPVFLEARLAPLEAPLRPTHDPSEASNGRGARIRAHPAGHPTPIS